MKKFSTWLLNEAISGDAATAVNKIILSYLKKKLPGPVHKMPGVEEYTNSTGRGYGVRYFYGDLKSVRFNWKGANISSFTLSSIDVWDGTTRDPNFHFGFDAATSLVKILPKIVDLLTGTITLGVTYAIPDDAIKEDKDLTAEIILEAATNPHDMFDALVGDFSTGKEIPVAQIRMSNPGGGSDKILNFLRNEAPFSNMFGKQGRSVVFTGTAADVKVISANKDKIMQGIGAVKITVTKGGRSETYEPTEQEKKIESIGIERIAYEQQLEDLELLMKLVIKGRSNALFVAGRGGTGKTQTVETELAKAGLQDGSGYFKNTGSASPVGIYTSLYNNKKGIVLFDDCDSALADQEGRNIIKAATDTKKLRKIAWNKKSSLMIPANQYEEEVENSDDGVPTDKNGNQLYPNSFEFEGRVIFISNLGLNKLDPDGALRTRGYIIEIDPTDAEMIDYMGKIAHKIKLEEGVLNQSEIDEVIAEIRANVSKTDLSLRKLVRGLEMKAEYGNDPKWKRLLQRYA